MVKLGPSTQVLTCLRNCWTANVSTAPPIVIFQLMARNGIYCRAHVRLDMFHCLQSATEQLRQIYFTKVEICWEVVETVP